MDLSLESLRKAVSLREQIDELERRLGALFGSETRASTKHRKRPMSAATRAKLAAAARKRVTQGGSKAVKAAQSGGKKRALTAAGQKTLREAMKTRWAAKHAAGSSLYGDPTTDPRPPVKKKYYR